MPPIYSNTPGGGIRSGAGIHRGAGLRGFGAGVLSPLTDGYYFFDPQSLTAGTVTEWDGSLPDSPNDLGLLAEQLTGGAQPTTDGTSVLFDSNAEHFDIPSTSQAGWQIVGTSLGTFAYKVDADAITELNLLGNLGSINYRQTGDLYGIILLPDTATAAQVEAARQLLISRGAADGVTVTSLVSFWRERADIVEFRGVNTSTVTDFFTSWFNCSSLTSFPLIDTSSASRLSYTWYQCYSLESFPLIVVTNAVAFNYTWYNCTSLESFPAGMFDTWNPSSIFSNVFERTWDGCTSLTPQSVENILVSIAASGKYATTSGASGGTALTDPEIDISYNGAGLTAATNTAINTLIERGWRVRINGELEMPFIEESGYYFFESEDLSAGNVASWDGSVTGAASLNLVAAQATGPDQPVADGTLVSFADNTDHLDIPSTSQAGWQIVGTSLGTFAYKVDADAITELNLLGNLGSINYRQTGDLYGIILLPATATAAQVEAARQLLISRGAADGVTSTSLTNAWRERADIVEFQSVDTSTVNDFYGAWSGCASLTSFPLIDTSSVTNFFTSWFNCFSLTSFPLIDTSSATNFQSAWYNCTSLTSFPSIDTSLVLNVNYAWYGCNSLTSFPLIDTSSVTSFLATWYGCNSLTSFPLIDLSRGTIFRSTWLICTSLTSFPAGMFDSWNPSSITNDVFDRTWDGCASLTPQSVENILVSIAASGKYATTSGASGGTALTDPEIDIDYDGTGLTTATNTAITTLKLRGWGIRINGTLQ